MTTQRLSTSTPPSSTIYQQKPQPREVPDDLRAIVIWYFDIVVFPTVSVLGLLGNVTSIVVISANGLRKPSNILLVALAVADFCFLIGSNNVPGIIYSYRGRSGWYYSQEGSFDAYILYHLMSTLYHLGVFCSLTLPVLITLDRLIAIFFPLHFKTLVTALRARVAVISLYILWGGVALYIPFCFRYFYVFDPNLNVFKGIMGPGPLTFHPSFDVVMITVNIMTEPIPLFFVLAGCIVIGVRVKVATARRNKMTLISAAPKKVKALTSKTTRSLMAVCVVYCLSSGIAYIQYKLTPEDHNLELILQKVRKLTLVINSSCNFLLYVAFNKNFRDTLFRLGKPRKVSESAMTGSTQCKTEDHTRKTAPNSEAKSYLSVSTKISTP